ASFQLRHLPVFRATGCGAPRTAWRRRAGLLVCDQLFRDLAMTDSIFIGGGGPDHKLAQSLLLARANRHGLVAGATGTGKTVTLQVMAEQFSAAGVPVFCADVKGDLSGICVAGAPEGKMLE